MPSLASLAEIVGFFSYSRRDDEHSEGALSRLRSRIHSELRLQLGRDFRLWQDTAAIPDGSLWEDEIKRAIAESVFFIPIVTPSSVGSKHCRFEFDSFLKREAELGRSNLIFPVLYVRVPALEREEEWREHDVLRVIGSRQYIDWQRLRHRSVADTEVAEKIEKYCRNIVEALRQPWLPPQERPAPETPRRQSGPQTAPAQLREPPVAEAPRPAPDDPDRHARRTAEIADDRSRRSDAAAAVGRRRPSTQTLRKRSLLAVGILSVLLAIGLAVYFYQRALLPQTVATATPPVASSKPEVAGCVDSLCGTVWTYTAASVSPPSHDIHFLQNHVLLWTEPGSSRARTGYSSTYRLTGKSVYFEINNRFSEYHGIVDGEHMSGTAENRDGKTWAWTAVKQ